MCKHLNTTWDGGEKVCTDCGQILPGRQYVVSHNRQFTYRRVPVYCRQKRFRNFLRSLDNSEINKNFDHILDCFGKLEFHYTIHKPVERQYFFNKHVTLHYIMKHLGLDHNSIPTLKDNDRIAKQCSMMNTIIQNSFNQ